MYNSRSHHSKDFNFNFNFSISIFYSFTNFLLSSLPYPLVGNPRLSHDLANHPRSPPPFTSSCSSSNLLFLIISHPQSNLPSSPFETPLRNVPPSLLLKLTFLSEPTFRNPPSSPLKLSVTTHLVAISQRSQIFHFILY